MKALSIKQPWANLIASGQKTIEVRTWNTRFRGEVVIVSSAKPPIHPAGSALCVVQLIESRPMMLQDAKAACLDYSPNLFSWVLSDLRLIRPFPVKGRLGFYELSAELICAGKK